MDPHSHVAPTFPTSRGTGLHSCVAPNLPSAPIFVIPLASVPMLQVKKSSITPSRAELSQRARREREGKEKKCKTEARSSEAIKCSFPNQNESKKVSSEIHVVPTHISTPTLPSVQAPPFQVKKFSVTPSRAELSQRARREREAQEKKSKIEGRVSEAIKGSSPNRTEFEKASSKMPRGVVPTLPSTIAPPFQNQVPFVTPSRREVSQRTRREREAKEKICKMGALSSDTIEGSSPKQNRFKEASSNIHVPFSPSVAQTSLAPSLTLPPATQDPRLDVALFLPSPPDPGVSQTLHSAPIFIQPLASVRMFQDENSSLTPSRAELSQRARREREAKEKKCKMEARSSEEIKGSLLNQNEFKKASSEIHVLSARAPPVQNKKSSLTSSRASLSQRARREREAKEKQIARWKHGHDPVMQSTQFPQSY